jgi:hypothetical protein
MMVVLIGNNTAGSGIGIAANGVTPIVRVERGAIGGNAGVGLQLGTATYTINNTFIVNNGGGGVTIGTPGAGSRFEFNTVVSNGGATLPTGMRCASTAQIASSIFSANGVAPQISDMCVATYSLFDDAAGQNNTGDKLGSPAFVSALDPHIQGTSPARNAADPAAVLNIDIDGEHRPQGANRDMGADEIP